MYKAGGITPPSAEGQLIFALGIPHFRQHRGSGFKAGSWVGEETMRV
jgi:hypothetical protein